VGRQTGRGFEHGLLELLQAWNVVPTGVKAPERGTNNLVRIVHTATSTYVLRIHQNATAQQVAAERRLLTALADAGLPFEVPVPMPTVDGRPTLATEYGPATLTQWTPGGHPARDSRGLGLAGAALGQLHVALASLPVRLAPTDWSTRPLNAIHPHVTDLDELAAEMMRALPTEPGARWFADRAPEIEARTTRWYEVLPRQIVHGDYALGNVLVAGDQVTAILDFEVAGIDMRLIDVAAALLQSTDDLRPDEVAAFCGGYASHVHLTEGEHDALPTVLRYRTLGSAIWRAGRWRAGHATLDEVADRLRDGARIDSLADSVRATGETA
jgi:homoserine kinase type II